MAVPMSRPDTIVGRPSTPALLTSTSNRPYVVSIHLAAASMSA
ncbi:hypothetical protein FHS43_005456 [Streptosporangium becharense]|uniref:Uncharacterized protein n=1 Tax=Streptosporangium becharense TaxID=1816182 RepID=A0A7W9IB62_9ACTN|nr:hypothetical protein [Streptosporangium becharense]MBB5817171.1 hypothetical protein [Streptosporangium becharense]